MELVKKNIHMNHWKGNVSTQITLDDDFIVPDTMDDMEQVILNDAEIIMESVKNQGEKVNVRGKLEFFILYRKESGGLQTLAGNIPFEETINVPDLDEHDYTQVNWELEDLNAGIINSRKLSMKAVVTLDVRVETLHDVEAAVDVDTETWNDGGEKVQIEALKRDIDVAVIAARKKDTHRVKEQIALPGNKPNIDEILWKEIKLRAVNTRPLDGKVHLDGELVAFIIYSSDGENTPLQWLEEIIAFNGDIDMPDIVEEMVPSIGVKLIHKELEAKPDYDGEMRELEIDAVLELDMKLYEEQKVELLSDLYSTNREVTIQNGEACFDQMLAKNTCKCKIAEKININNTEKILQICHSQGQIKIDDIEIADGGLQIDGVLDLQLLYLTADDNEPIKASAEMIPFHYMAEAKGINEESIYQITSGIEQLNAAMLGGDTVEVKAVVILDLLVLQPVCEPIITYAGIEPMNLQKLQELPGIVGYIVQPEDTLWKIAKKFHTTVDNIIMTNGLSENKIKSGERLILVKEIARS